MPLNESLQETTAPTRTFYAVAISFVAAVGGFLYGYDIGVIIGANLFLREQFQLTDAGFALASSSMIIGSISGPFLGGWLCDWVGRKSTFLIASLLLAISAVLTAVPNDITTFNFFRFVGGLGIGLCSMASPMYIAEIAPARMRGSLGLMYQLAIVVGSLVAGCVSWLLASYLPEDVSWRWMFFSEMVAIVIPHAIGLGSLPWLMMSELYPTRIRAKAVAITTTVLWGAGFTGSFVFPMITGFAERKFSSIGPAFWLFACVCVLSFIFGLKWLPETKGKTLEEIAESWERETA